jgi:hypothetical protein
VTVSTSILVDGSRPVPPTYGLIPAADVAPPPDGHWALGAELTPYPVGPARAYPGPCTTGTTKTADGLPGSVDVLPFALYKAITCTTRGEGPAWFRERVRAVFDAVEGAGVEAEFWTGAMVPSNPNLTDAGAHDLTGATAVKIPEAIGLIEAYALPLVGSDLMIHMSPLAGEKAFSAMALEKNGRIFTTRLGTTVVVGGGYPGTPPGGLAANSGQKEWIIATNGVTLLRGPVQGLPEADDDPSIYNRTTNDLTIVVEREYLIAWDKRLHAAAQVDRSL